MTRIALLISIFTVLPTTVYAKNPTGNAPKVICTAQEFTNGVNVMETPFTRFDLSMNPEIGNFLPSTVLEGSRFRMQVVGSVNSEQELWLRIEDKENPNLPIYSRGLLSGALTRVVDSQNYARVTCDQEVELRERYLAEFCNADGTVRSPEGRQYLEEITRACVRLHEIGVIKEEKL